jgi:hypothetical protein
VFVSNGTGDDGNDGSQEKPVRTIAHAIELADAKKPIYACAGAMPFSEVLLVLAGTEIYGGLDCASWKYVGDMAKTTITGMSQRQLNS